MLVQCPEFPVPANAQSSCTDEGLKQFNEQCTATCTGGFQPIELEAEMYTCGPDGAWLNAVANGLICEDIGECLVNNGGCPSHQTCTESIGSFSCGDCTEGYNRATPEAPCLPSQCAPSSLERSNRVDGADGPCQGNFMDECIFVCDVGTVASGVHVCGPHGTFEGGSCVPDQCTDGLQIVNSKRGPDHPCDGGSEDECSYTCNDGYAPSGQHVCMADH